MQFGPRMVFGGTNTSTGRGWVQNGLRAFLCRSFAFFHMLCSVWCVHYMRWREEGAKVLYGL